jgi:hypothetical protein
VTAKDDGRFDWRSFLVLAERLAAQSADEDVLRTAIGRAYYAAFAVARNRLRDHDCWRSGRDPHTRVWATYRNSNNLNCQRIGDRGFNLRDRRHRADYDDDIGPNLDRQASAAIRIAREILALIDGLAPDEGCCGLSVAPENARRTPEGHR